MASVTMNINAMTIPVSIQSNWPSVFSPYDGSLSGSSCPAILACTTGKNDIVLVSVVQISSILLIQAGIALKKLIIWSPK